MRTVLLLAAILLVVAIIANVSCVSKGIDLGQEIGAPLNRAQVAANPTDMDRLMEKVQTGMEKHGLTQGHWGFQGMTGLNANDDNDFAEAYKAVKSIRERLVVAKGFDQSSIQYQVALDDIRGTIRELNIGQQDWNNWSYWWIFPLYVVVVIFFVVGLMWEDS